MANFDAQLKANDQFLSDKERNLARFLVKNRESIKTSSLQDISKKTNVSIATVSRFAKKLGFDSFQELRFSLQNSSTKNPSPMFEEINDTDSLEEMADKIFAANIDALETTGELLSEEKLNQAVCLLKSAPTIGFFGLGASNIVALDGYHKFLRTEKTISYAADYHMQLMAITRMKSADAAIIVSHSGTDKSALALAEAAKNSGVHLIVITSSNNSPLAQMADVCFAAVAEEMEFRSEAIHAMIAQISLMDTLFVLTTVKSEQDDSEVLAKIRETIQKTRN